MIVAEIYRCYINCEIGKSFYSIALKIGENFSEQSSKKKPFNILLIEFNEKIKLQITQEQLENVDKCEIFLYQYKKNDKKEISAKAHIKADQLNKRQKQKFRLINNDGKSSLIELKIFFQNFRNTRQQNQLQNWEDKNLHWKTNFSKQIPQSDKTHCKGKSQFFTYSKIFCQQNVSKFSDTQDLAVSYVFNQSKQEFNMKNQSQYKKQDIRQDNRIKKKEQNLAASISLQDQLGQQSNLSQRTIPHKQLFKASNRSIQKEDLDDFSGSNVVYYSKKNNMFISQNFLKGEKTSSSIQKSKKRKSPRLNLSQSLKKAHLQIKSKVAQYSIRFDDKNKHYVSRETNTDYKVISAQKANYGTKNVYSTTEDLLKKIEAQIQTNFDLIGSSGYDESALSATLKESHSNILKLESKFLHNIHEFDQQRQLKQVYEEICFKPDREAKSFNYYQFSEKDKQNISQFGVQTDDFLFSQSKKQKIINNMNQRTDSQNILFSSQFSALSKQLVLQEQKQMFESFGKKKILNKPRHLSIQTDGIQEILARKKARSSLQNELNQFVQKQQNLDISENQCLRCMRSTNLKFIQTVSIRIRPTIGAAQIFLSNQPNIANSRFLKQTISKEYQEMYKSIQESQTISYKSKSLQSNFKQTLSRDFDEIPKSIQQSKTINFNSKNKLQQNNDSQIDFLGLPNNPFSNFRVDATESQNKTILQLSRQQQKFFKLISPRADRDKVQLFQFAENLSQTLNNEILVSLAQETDSFLESSQDYLEQQKNEEEINKIQFAQYKKIHDTNNCKKCCPQIYEANFLLTKANQEVIHFKDIFQQNLKSITKKCYSQHVTKKHNQDLQLKLKQIQMKLKANQANLVNITSSYNTLRADHDNLKNQKQNLDINYKVLSNNFLNAKRTILFYEQQYEENMAKQQYKNVGLGLKCLGDIFDNPKSPEKPPTEKNQSYIMQLAQLENSKQDIYGSKNKSRLNSLPKDNDNSFISSNSYTLQKDSKVQTKHKDRRPSFFISSKSKSKANQSNPSKSLQKSQSFSINKSSNKYSSNALNKYLVQGLNKKNQKTETYRKVNLHNRNSSVDNASYSKGQRLISSRNRKNQQEVQNPTKKNHINRTQSLFQIEDLIAQKTDKKDAFDNRVSTQKNVQKHLSIFSNFGS